MKSHTPHSIVHLTSFQSLWEADQIRILLHQNNIECFIPNENSVAIGTLRHKIHKGIEIQVFHKDYNNAVALLAERGYKISNVPNIIYSERFDQISKKITVLSHLPYEIRFVILIAMILIPIAVLVALWLSL